MASVSWTGLMWLNTAADVSQAMSFPLNSLEYDPVVQVASRLYAGGNYRMIVTPGRQKTAKVTLGFCTSDQVAFLQANQGVLVCFRDSRGEKFYGFYTDSVFTPIEVSGLWSVSLTVQEVTYSEVA